MESGWGGLIVFFDLGSNAHSMWISLIQKRKKGRGRENVYDTLVSKKKKKTHPLPYLFKVEILKRFVQAEKKKTRVSPHAGQAQGRGERFFFFFFVHPNTGRRILFYFFFQNIEMKVFFVCVWGAGAEHSK